MSAVRRCQSALAVLALLGMVGCASNSADWFHPDWDSEYRRADEPQVDPESIIEAEFEAPPTLPDVDIEGPIELSVEQAVFLALQRNRELRVAQLTPVITGAFEQVERGAFDPEVFADVEFGREESLESARSTGEQFSVEGNSAEFNAGVRQELPTGTDVEIGVTQDRTISNRSPEQQTARVGLTVTQSLLRGFGPAVNLAAVRQAELETEASRYELRGFLEALLAETEIAYWEHLLAQRTIEIVERSLAVAEQQAEQIMQRIDVGVVPETEAAAARSEVARRQLALIGARADLRAAKLRLARLLNAPMDLAGERDLVATSVPGRARDVLIDLDERIELAQKMRPDLNEARLRLDQDRLETIRTRNGLLPRLDLFLAFGKTGYADTFSDSFRELDGPTYDATVGVSFSQYIGRSAAQGAYEGAIASRRQAALAVENLTQLVELDVRLAANEAERARQQIDATINTRELEEETARAEVERFEVGASTALLVAQAQRDLLQAQLAEVEAVANHRIALIQLYLAEGSLLERRGIRVGP
jgi:outer membrane protein